MIQSRYRRILWFFARSILTIIWWEIVLPRFGLRGLSRRTRTERLRRITVEFRAMAVRMGGVMIKVGQFLSARLDVLPRVITDELAGLQDEVRPESFDAIRQVIEMDFKAPLEETFLSFDPVPLASASIGQVHRAELRQAGPGLPTTVVVKVQRPNIQRIVETDLAALRVVSRWVQRYPPIRRRVSVPALLEEFSHTLYEEIDYLHEGKNGETFASNFADQPDVCVPRIHWNHTTRRVLTQEEVRGIKITDYASLESGGVSRSEAARCLFNTYLKQIFEDRFFHADPHPGNLFILPSGTDEPETHFKLIFVDFGMAGTVPANLLAGMRELLIAIGTRDVARITKGYQQMGVLLPGADVELLEKAGQRVFDRFWGKSTTEMVNMGHQEAVAFAREFGDLLYELPFQVPENLILLGRCLGILSGICTGLDPDFNIWTQVMPYTRRLIEAESDGQNVWLKEGMSTLQTLVSLPRRTEAMLQRIEQGRLEVQMPEVKEQFHRLELGINRLAGAVLFAAFLVTAAQVFLAGHSELALAAAAVGFMFFIVMVIRK